MNSLIVESLQSDERFVRGKELLMEALQAAQEKLSGVSPAIADRKVSYAEMIHYFGEMRGGPLFYPYLGSGMGSGPFVELADGSVKYDFISGIGVHHLGHGSHAVVEACIDAALRDTVMQGNLQQNLECVELTERLISLANARGASMAHCFLTSSGAMANENALKLMLQHNQPASRILAFEGCFMGRTLAMAQITDNAAYRVGLPTTLAVDYVPFYDPQRPEASIDEAMSRLNGYLKRYPGQYACMCFELVQGEGGFHPGERSFFVALMERLKESGISILVDEIQTFGRTSELFAFQTFGLDQYVDVVTVGKLSQICAALFRGELKPGPGLLSQTFTASTAAIFSARAILKELTQGGYFGPEGKIARIRAHVVERLEELVARHPTLISGPFGIGAMIAFTVFNGDPEKVKAYLHALFDKGVVAFFCGREVARVRFLLPAGGITFDQIDAAMELVEEALLEVA